MVVWPPGAGVVADLVTGQMVVLTATVLVITAVGVPGRSGQSVTVGAQEVIVTSLVLYTVEVVYDKAVLFLDTGWTGALDVAYPPGEVEVTGQTVVLIGIVLVITAVEVPDRSGQSVTVGAQEVIVTSLVL